MSDQSSHFHFTPEKESSTHSDRPEENFSFFLKIISVCAVSLSIGVWFTSHTSDQKLNSDRTIQSSWDPSAVQETINLESFVVPLKSDQGAKLTRVEVVLQVNDSLVLREIQESSHKIRNHLIFILSKKHVSVFDDIPQRESLKREIITQLNQFLVGGQIENIQLKQTFLN